MEHIVWVGAVVEKAIGATDKWVTKLAGKRTLVDQRMRKVYRQ